MIIINTMDCIYCTLLFLYCSYLSTVANELEVLQIKKKRLHPHCKILAYKWARSIRSAKLQGRMLSWLPVNWTLPLLLSFKSGIRIQRAGQQHTSGFSHCCCSNVAFEGHVCGGQGAYWWVCLLASMTFTRLTENVSECQMLALVMMQLLKSLNYWSIASLPSPNSRLLSPCPFTRLFSLLLLSSSLSSPALYTCQRSEVIGLNNGSYAHAGWNSQHLLSFLGSAGIAQAVFRHEKSSPVLHEWATYHTIM